MSWLNLELDGNTIFYYNFKKNYRKIINGLLFCIYYLEKYFFEELKINYRYNNVYKTIILLGLCYFQYFLLRFL